MSATGTREIATSLPVASLAAEQLHALRKTLQNPPRTVATVTVGTFQRSAGSND
tara:strand:- start:1037 stop:1198 length:162 start_codon:yes stop_codon:yes gene_type:complete